MAVRDVRAAYHYRYNLIIIVMSSAPEGDPIQDFCHRVINSIKIMLNGDIAAAMNGEAVLEIPKHEAKDIITLANAVTKIFQNEPVVLKADFPLIIVGDIHGHLLDLCRILGNFGFPPSQRYLFLGDLVDRGEFSTESITLIYALKYLYPNDVLIIRGNHEFISIAGGGFGDEAEQLYPRKRVFGCFADSFVSIPLAAVLFNKIICVHGGPCPDLASIQTLTSIQRPISNFDDPLICGILWSDPSFNITGYSPSRRGTGWLFGNQALAEFLSSNNLNMLIRGHECVSEGYELCFDNQLLTVFSASNYCGETNNKAAVAIIKSATDVEPIDMPPLGYLKRVTTRPRLTINDPITQNVNLSLPHVLRVKDVVVGPIVDPNSKLSNHLNVGEKLKNITRYRSVDSDTMNKAIHRIMPVCQVPDKP